ncbi:hypothetical protein [Pseudoroseicyclus sp. CXY001]|uniref:hypothetical protein n=1 Tax=Pseudoroseicyclus sp. CXY001 TaxID=3242492 RepID=UPI0035714333
MLTTFDKAFAPLIVGALVYLLSLIGISPEMTVGDVLELLVASVAGAITTYITPNKGTTYVPPD